MKICDLHTHSDFSDGTCTPHELVREAANKGICAIALTDHNTVDGLPSFLAETEKAGVEGVGGVELSCDFEGGEIHLLALFLEERHYDSIRELCRELAHNKEESNRILVSRLIEDGYDIDDIDTIYRKSVHGNVNRAHIAEALMRGGYVTSVKEAFSGILSVERGYFVPPERIDPIQAVKLIRSMGAVSIIAHPYLNMTQEKLERFLSVGVEAGLHGMETYYPEYDRATHILARETARRFGLAESGGSDYHGTRKKERSLSSENGFYAPYELYEKLLSIKNRKSR